MERTVTLEVPQEAAGERLDRFLANALDGCTRSAIRRLIDDGRVLLDGVAASKAGANLSSGAWIEVHIPGPEPEDGPQAEKIPLVVRFEDAHLLVLDKPAGVVVHPGHGNRRGTIVNALLGRGTTLAAAGRPDRPGIVHRLDRGTSGLLAVAKTDLAYDALCSAFAMREVRKEYTALVWGHVDPPAGTIERKIGRSRSDRLKMTVGTAQGRPAITRYRTRERLPGFTLLSAFPETGRTHQIRTHLLSIHHSVVGDERYGGRPWRGVQDRTKRRLLREFDRLALHATRLAFSHPVTGETLELHAPLPAEFEKLLAGLRRG